MAQTQGPAWGPGCAWGLWSLLECKTGPAHTFQGGLSQCLLSSFTHFIHINVGPKAMPFLVPTVLAFLSKQWLQEKINIGIMVTPRGARSAWGAEEAGERFWTHRCHPSSPSTRGEGDSLGMTPRQRQPAV